MLRGSETGGFLFASPISPNQRWRLRIRSSPTTSRVFIVFSGLLILNMCGRSACTLAPRALQRRLGAATFEGQVRQLFAILRPIFLNS